jgi:putative (di)nucleoside polyphosphate hydrolase
MTSTPEPLPGYRRNVGIMLINSQGLIFVGSRRDMPSGAWQMPQGGIDGDETPRQAVMRELYEEVGTDKASIIGESAGWLSYELPAKLAKKLWRGKWRGQSQKWFAMRFTGTDDDINIATAHPEFAAWRWVKPSQIVDLIVPFKRDLYRAVLDELGHLAVAQK